MAPAFTVLVQYVVLEGDPLFLKICRHLLHSYLGAYTPTDSTLGPLGTDYSDCSSIGQAPERRDIDTDEEGGDGNTYTYIITLSLGY